jgi:hypothetical protein
VKALWKNLEEWLLILFLLLIPSQLGKHFWPVWSMVMGVRVDYLSPTLYLLDLVWLGLVLTTIVNDFKKKNKPKIEIGFGAIVVVLLVILNILVAGNRWVAIYRWLRVGQWLVTFKLLVNRKKTVVENLGWIVPTWVIVETLLAIAQVVKGGSVGGWWYWLGERRFDFTSIGVAQISWWGQGAVRAYGTFSHPNSLAGFLLLILAWWFDQKNVRKVWWWLTFWLLLVGVIVCGSRVVWALSVGMMLWKFWDKQGRRIDKKMLGILLVVLGMVMIILSIVAINYQLSDFVGGWDSDSVQKRMTLNWVAMRMWRDNFVLGEGLGNFTSSLPSFVAGSAFYWWQPVHNIFLLWGAETGILGVMGLVWVVSSWWKNKWWKKWSWIFVVIIVTGMLDHYWLTLPQNSWLLAVILAVL